MNGRNDEIIHGSMPWRDNLLLYVKNFTGKPWLDDRLCVKHINHSCMTYFQFLLFPAKKIIAETAIIVMKSTSGKYTAWYLRPKTCDSNKHHYCEVLCTYYNYKNNIWHKRTKRHNELWLSNHCTKFPERGRNATGFGAGQCRFETSEWHELGIVRVDWQAELRHQQLEHVAKILFAVDTKILMN